MSFRGAQLRLDANKATVAPYNVSWDAAEIDTEGFWSIANPTKLIVPIGVSLIRIDAQVRCSDNNTFGSLFVNTNKNNSRLFDGAAAWTYRRSQSTLHGTVNGVLNFANLHTGPLAVVAGDEFEIRVNASNAPLADLLQSAQTWVQVRVLDDVWSGCAVKATVERSVTNGDSGVIWDAVFQSTDGAMFDPANPTRLTVPLGVSKIRLAGVFERNPDVSGHSSYLRIRKNDVTDTTQGFAPKVRGTGGAGSGYTNNVLDFSTEAFAVLPGDYFEVLPVDSSTVIDKVLTATSWFEMEIVE